jgi:hypothetical protein
MTVFGVLPSTTQAQTAANRKRMIDAKIRILKAFQRVSAWPQDAAEDTPHAADPKNRIHLR